MRSATPSLTSRGYPLNPDPDAFGELRDSTALLGDPEALRQQLLDDGYLLIRNYFDEEEVIAARRSMTGQLAKEGMLDPHFPSIEAVIAPGKRSAFRPDIAEKNAAVERVVFGPRILAFYEQLFGGPVRHFDYTWVRAVGPGMGTDAHCDIVYMGRGTRDLLTCWIPYGKVTLELGGLMVLEKSHTKASLLKNYLSRDVDAFCENKPDQVAMAERGGSNFRGALTTNPVSLQEKLGGRWLTTKFGPGDFVTFGMELVHASLDNQTDRIRLSTDTRYQLASEPIDERWIGEKPVGHSTAGKKGRIC